MTAFPVTRLRRLRRTETLRALVRETQLSLDDVVMPLFACPGEGVVSPVPGLDGIAQRSVDEIVREAAELASLGVRAVLLFGIPEEKDEEGSGAWDADGIVQRALRALRAEVPGLTLVTDVCLCEYTSHGHCGVLRDGEVDNDETLELLARTAVSHVEAGADVVAPSDMMDGRVGAIRAALPQTPIVAYAAKYASAFYGPFREVAESAPAVRRPPRLPDGPAERARGAAGVRARPRGGRRRADGEAGAPVPRRDPRRARAVRLPGRGLQRLGRVRDGEGRGGRGPPRRARGRARVARRDQARGRRPRVHVLGEGPRRGGSDAASDLYDRATAADPRRGQLAGAGDAGGRRSTSRCSCSAARAPTSRTSTATGTSTGCSRGGRCSSATPTRSTLEAVAEALARGTTFGAPTEARGRARGGDRRRGAVDRDGAARLLGHGGVDERGAPGARRHAARPADQVRRQLPRPRRRAARERRLGPDDARDPLDPGRSRRRRRATRSCSPTTTSTRSPPPSRATERGSRRSSSSRSPGNMGVVPPAPGFLEALRALCDASGALLVFDEVITGFRVARGGAQERYGVTPDLTILGKIVGGGLPAAAFGGRGRADGAARARSATSTRPARSPATRSRRRPGLSVLRRLRDPAVYDELERRGARLEAGPRPLRHASSGSARC